LSGTSHLRLRGLWAALLALDVAIQVAMKIAGDQLAGHSFGAEWVAAALGSWMIWLSLVGYFATFFLWLAILQTSLLSAAFPATAVVYALVPFCGWLLFDEHLSLGQVAGIALIIAGVFLQRDGADDSRSP
jgi:drug/metabolite transporter (DMT)-like permease